MIRNLTDRLAEEIQKHMGNKDPFIPTRELQIVLQSILGKMDLVTREEFDAQAAVLQRTREKLEVLEQKLSQLEN